MGRGGAQRCGLALLQVIAGSLEFSFCLEMLFPMPPPFARFLFIMPASPTCLFPLPGSLLSRTLTLPTAQARPQRPPSLGLWTGLGLASTYNCAWLVSAQQTPGQ